MEPILVLTSIGIAGMVQGATGFGFGLVGLALLANLVPLTEATLVIVPGVLGVNAVMLFKLRAHVRPRRVTPLLVASLCAVPLGVLFLARADLRLLRYALGVVLILSALQPLVPGLAKKQWHPVWLGVPCGLASGVLSGAFSTGGPPLVAYLAGQRLPKYAFAGTLQLLFACNALTRITCLSVGGFFTREVVGLGLLGVVCAAAGAWVGLKLLTRIPEVALRRLVLAALFLLGVRYLVT